MNAPGPPLRHRIEQSYVSFLAAFDEAAGSSDTAVMARLEAATDALMRALAQVLIQLGETRNRPS
jgi:hypothetical protein